MSGGIKTLNTVSGESIESILEVPGRNIKNVSGIASAGGGGDAFVSACRDTGKLFGLWTCQDVNTGDLADGATIMTDLSGKRPSKSHRYSRRHRRLADWRQQRARRQLNSLNEVCFY